MNKCIVVDDEKIILDELCALIRETEMEVAGAFRDPYEAFNAVLEIRPDAVFCDIEMPGMNGIELAKKIGAFDPEIQIVFVTAYEEYALKAFEVCAVHYILKPLTQEQIQEAVKRVLRVRRMCEKRGEVREPVMIKSQAGVPDRISVRERDDVVILKIPDIVYLKSEKGKTVIVTKRGSYNSRAGLQFWEDKLKELDFLRCHRSFIVNTAYITKMVHVLGDYRELILDYCDASIPISRQKTGVVKEWMGIL
jgi:DNA-binding LytR/AlgR family response regulator